MGRPCGSLSAVTIPRAPGFGLKLEEAIFGRAVVREGIRHVQRVDIEDRARRLRQLRERGGQRSLHDSARPQDRVHHGAVRTQCGGRRPPPCDDRPIAQRVADQRGLADARGADHDDGAVRLDGREQLVALRVPPDECRADVRRHGASVRAQAGRRTANEEGHTQLDG